MSERKIRGRKKSDTKAYLFRVHENFHVWYLVRRIAFTHAFGCVPVSRCALMCLCGILCMRVCVDSAVMGFGAQEAF